MISSAFIRGVFVHMRSRVSIRVLVECSNAQWRIVDHSVHLYLWIRDNACRICIADLVAQPKCVRNLLLFGETGKWVTEVTEVTEANEDRGKGLTKWCTLSHICHDRLLNLLKLLKSFTSFTSISIGISLFPFPSPTIYVVVTLGSFRSLIPYILLSNGRGRNTEVEHVAVRA